MLGCNDKMFSGINIIIHKIANNRENIVKKITSIKVI